MPRRGGNCDRRGRSITSRWKPTHWVFFSAPLLQCVSPPETATLPHIVSCTQGLMLRNTTCLAHPHSNHVDHLRTSRNAPPPSPGGRVRTPRCCERWNAFKKFGIPIVSVVSSRRRRLFGASRFFSFFFKSSAVSFRGHEAEKKKERRRRKQTD